MNTSKYVKLDQEAIRRDYADVFKKYEGTHMITAVPGVKVDLRKLNANESICYGDGKSFHFKLSKVTP
jgi:hypothetical protein